MQRTDYRFTLTRDTDTFEVTPDGFFDGSFKYTQNEGQLFFRREFEGEFIFRKTDYNYIKARYDAGNYCDIYELLIEKKVSGEYQVDWLGYFSMLDGKFDFERCKYTVKPTVQDKYSCLLRNWETQYNIIGVGLTKYPITSNIVSNLEIQFKFNGQTEITTLKSMTTWRDVDYEGCGMDLVTHYAREAIILPKGLNPGGAWELNDSTGNSYSDYGIDQTLNFLSFDENSQNKWVRAWTYSYSSPQNIDFIMTYAQNTLQAVLNLCYSGSASDYRLISEINWPNEVGTVLGWNVKNSYQLSYITDVTITYNTCLKTTDVIKYLLEQTCPTDFANPVLTSNFLTNATNPVTGLASKTNNLFLIQKSDAKKPEASNAATKGEISFKMIIESLYNAFQLWWHINDNDELSIVHQSEIENTVGLNITVNPYLKTTAHFKAIEFNKSLIYRYEKWQFMEANGEDFVGLPIEYNELCVNKDESTRTKNYSISDITTDLAYVQTNVDKISDDGFVLLATDGNDVLIEEGVISGVNQLNGNLSLANLHDKYWRHNRILSTGILNGESVTFESTQKIRKLKELSIIYSGEFDPNELITTDLGNAIVNEAEFFPLDKTIVLNMSI